VCLVLRQTTVCEILLAEHCYQANVATQTALQC